MNYYYQADHIILITFQEYCDQDSAGRSVRPESPGMEGTGGESRHALDTTRMERKLVILQVNGLDIAGGAEVIATNLHRRYLEMGQESYLLVGNKRGSDLSVEEIDLAYGSTGLQCFLLSRAARFKKTKNSSTISRSLFYFFKFLAFPGSILPILTGQLDYNFPSSWKLLELVPKRPDIIHFHNLHGDYFDIRSLPWYCRQLPALFTLHDGWLLGQYCMFSNDCPEFENNCASCPNSSVVPGSMKRTQIANRGKKFTLFGKEHFFVVTPSGWMMKNVGASCFHSIMADGRVIPNGVDLRTFHLYPRKAARRELSLPEDALVLLFVANAVRTNPSKDFESIKISLSLVSERVPERNILLLAIGDSAPPETVGNARIEFIPFFSDPEKMAKYYQASDIYLHAAKVDNFPTTVIEALACGVPVIATAVGGIPEQIVTGETGFLTRPGDPSDMADKIELLLKNSSLREEMGERAYSDAKKRFGLDLQVERYLELYKELIDERNHSVLPQ